MVRYDTDVLVVGGGGAGSMAAIKASELGKKVILVSKCPIGRGGATEVAENFMQAPFGHADPRDNPAAYLEDTLQGGSGLGDQNLAQALSKECCDRITDLESYGVRFKKERGKFVQWKAPGLSFPRAIGPIGGGHGIMRALKGTLKSIKNVQILEDIVVTHCLTKGDSVSGVRGISLKNSEIIFIQAKATILATGGFGSLWSISDVPPDIIGDGISIAYRAGCELVDMEMVLFYPCVIIHPPYLYGTELPIEFLLEEEYIGGKLLNGRGEEFLPSPLPLRDRFCALMFEQIQSGKGGEHGGLILDITRSPYSMEELTKRLKQYCQEKFQYLLTYGIDLRRIPVEVSPMAHYTLGGVRINEWGETSIRGLLVAGELGGNCHGANRLAGNALAEIFVFGARAGQRGAEYARENHLPRFEESFCKEEERSIFKERGEQGKFRSFELIKELKELMVNYVGPVREKAGLMKALLELEEIKEKMNSIQLSEIKGWNLDLRDFIELKMMIEAAELVIRSALFREESRGHHFRRDFPERDDQNWLKHVNIKRVDGKMQFYTTPVIRI